MKHLSKKQVKKRARRKVQKVVVRRRDAKKVVACRRPSSSVPADVAPSSNSPVSTSQFAIKPRGFKWQGRRDLKEDRLTGEYDNQDLIANFETAFEFDSAFGYYHAREWLLKLFASGKFSSWPMNALRNIYRQVFGKEPREKLHAVIMKYMIYTQLSINWLRKELAYEKAASNKMFGTWCNLLPKLEAKLDAYASYNYDALPEISRAALLDEMAHFNRERYSDFDSTKKGVKIMAAKKSTKKASKKTSKKASKKTSAKKSKKVKKATAKKVAKEQASSAKHETVSDSILAVGRRKKGTVTRKWILNQIANRRKLTDDEKKNLRISTTLKQLCKKGEMTQVAIGQYSFDGSKKVIGTPPKKAAKKITTGGKTRKALAKAKKTRDKKAAKGAKKVAKVAKKAKKKRVARRKK